MKQIDNKEKKAVQKQATLKRRWEWGGWREWVNVILMYVVLEIAVLSVERAQWIDPQPSLSLVLFLSLAVIYCLIKLHVWAIFQHLITIIIGLGITLWQILGIIDQPTIMAKFNHLMNIFSSWLGGGQITFTGDDKLIFAVFITFITWIIGYLALWFIIKKHNPWIAVTLGALVMLFNISNLPDSYYVYFILYFFAAVLLIAVVRLTGRISTEGHTANYSGKSLYYLGASLLVITALASSFAWITPQVKATGLQDFIASRITWQKDLQESSLNIFNAIPSKQSISTTSSLRDLPFGNVWNQSDDIDFIVYAEQSSYWQLNTYDTYTSQGWTSDTGSREMLEANYPWTDVKQLTGGNITQYAVQTEIATDVLLTNGSFISADIPVLVNTTPDGDLQAVNAIRILEPGENYIVTTYAASPNATQLIKSGAYYPNEIPSRYLSLPATLPGEVRQLSQKLTRDMTTPYYKVLAIRNYLASNFTYKLEIPPLPEGEDSVAYFLFQRKNGFCLHFASAMVVMLRSINVPARLAIGYLPGEITKTPGQYLLRDKSFHAWAQVNFPGYGWINVEATPVNTITQTEGATTSSSGGVDYMPFLYYQPGGHPMELDMQAMLNADYGNLTNNSSSDSLSFFDKLWRALLFIFIAAIIIGAVIGIYLLIRSLSFGWLWKVDRQNLGPHIYMNMCKLAAMAGITPRPEQTPLEFAAELGAMVPEQAADFDYITRLYLDTRFGGRPGKPDFAVEAEVLKVRRTAYNALIRRFDKLRRRFGQK